MAYKGRTMPPLTKPPGECVIEPTEPCGCHLQSIGGVAGTFSFVSGAKQFDALLKSAHGQGDGYHGEYTHATICSIQIPDEATEAGLKERGFQLLGIQDGAHGAYKMALWGRGFTIPRRTRTKKEIK